jgi:hypothetical protein
VRLQAEVSDAGPVVNGSLLEYYSRCTTSIIVSALVTIRCHAAEDGRPVGVLFAKWHVRRCDPRPRLRCGAAPLDGAVVITGLRLHRIWAAPLTLLSS